MDNPLSLLSAMITPAVLISACGTLIMSTSLRLARIVDRVRELSRETEEIFMNEAITFGEEIPISGIRTTAQGYPPPDDKIRQKFTGYEKDTETGLDYAQARYYSNVQGRFSSVDPLNILFEEQFSSDLEKSKKRKDAYLSDPSKWNKYTYALNNPLKIIDPDGRDALVVAYTDYKAASSDGTRVPLSGHGAIIIIEKNGDTSYFEYGRYDTEQKGEAHKRNVPKVEMDANGQPTAQSMSKLLKYISEQHQGSTIEGAYFKTTEKQDKDMIAYGLDLESKNIRVVALGQPSATSCRE